MMRAESASAYVQLTSGGGSGGSSDILRYGNNALPTAVSADGGAVAIGDDIGPSVATLLESFMGGQSILPILTVLQHSVVLLAEMPLAEDVSSSIVLGVDACDVSVHLNNCVVIGRSACASNPPGSNCVIIGHQAQVADADDANCIVIGAAAAGGGPNTITIGKNSVTHAWLYGQLLLHKMLSLMTPVPLVASNTTIAPVSFISRITGTTTIETITPPAEIISLGAMMILIFASNCQLGNTPSGNIARNTSCLSGRAYTLIWDPNTNMWHASE